MCTCRYDSVRADPFGKYTGGFEGKYADVNTFFGGQCGSFCLLNPRRPFTGLYRPGPSGSHSKTCPFFPAGTGLTKLIGEPKKDVGSAMEREHCCVGSGFGASDGHLTAANYGVRFTPRTEYANAQRASTRCCGSQEQRRTHTISFSLTLYPANRAAGVCVCVLRCRYTFVADADDDTPMDMGISPLTKARLGQREKLTVESLLANAVRRITDEFERMGWGANAPTADSFARLCITREEVIGLRLYTVGFEIFLGLQLLPCTIFLVGSHPCVLHSQGPMFFVYNTVLRATASEGQTIDFGVPDEFLGCSVRGLFTTTLHAINSGVIKLSRMQPAYEAGTRTRLGRGEDRSPAYVCTFSAWHSARTAARTPCHFPCTPQV